MESGSLIFLSLSARTRRWRHRPDCHGGYFPRLSPAAARPGDGYLFTGLDIWPHPRTDARGYLTDAISWRAIFYINLPLGIVGVVMAVTIMAGDLSGRRSRVSISWAW